MTLTQTKPSSPLLNLNTEQKAAAYAREGYWKIEAGPGSGKTHTLINRYLGLLSESNPSQILCLTFTNEAAKEMRMRAGVVAETARPSGFRTLHSLALDFVIRERVNFPYKLDEYFPLATPDLTKKFLGWAVKQAGKVRFREFASRISELKRGGLNATTAVEAAVNSRDFDIARGYQEYEALLRQEGKLDFDDLMIETRKLLMTNREVCDRWQYQWVMVDEAPDCDGVQYDLIRLLSLDNRNVWFVGDINQVIYEWRGAKPELFRKLDELFPGLKTLYLPTNYRSSPQIVEFVKKIAPEQGPLVEQMRSACGDGPEPDFRAFQSDMDEAEYVAEETSKCVSPKKDAVAILARTNRQLGILEEILGEKGVKYHLLGKSGFWNQPEIRNALAYLQIAHIPTDAAIIAAIRAPFEPSRYIRKKEFIEDLKAEGRHYDSLWHTLRGWQNQKSQQLHSAFERIRRSVHLLDAKKVTETVLREIHAFEHYGDDEAPDSSPANNLRLLVEIAGRFGTLGDFLSHVRKAQAAQRGRKNRVVLSTGHQSKGKEWDTVFIVGAAEGLIPHNKSENIEEEARVFFVMASRAAQRLAISWYGVPSRFLASLIPSIETAQDVEAEKVLHLWTKEEA